MVIEDVVARILHQRTVVPESRSLLVGVSGIDGCGKGFVSQQIVARLGLNSIAAVNINVDGWLNLPHARFNSTAPAEHFYEKAIRFPEFFAQLVLPLRDRRSIYLVADFAEETATKYRKHVYSFKNVSVVVVEGILLFKREYRNLFDLAIWIDCSFSTALARAIERRQEGLPLAATIEAYETIYFPAQRIHLDRDDPRERADLIVNNDSYVTTNKRRYKRARESPAKVIAYSSTG